MAKNDIVRIGTDSSGRPIRASEQLRDWYNGLCFELGWKPVIVQGAWRSLDGGGASASAGTHDKDGCLDFRTRDLSEAKKRELIRTARLGGMAIWLRTPANSGMDEHAHGVLGVCEKMHEYAVSQWQEYLRGDDGLVGSGDDMHWRPDPLVTRPPVDWGKRQDRLKSRSDK